MSASPRAAGHEQLAAYDALREGVNMSPEKKTEAPIRIGAVILIIWLIIGAIAGAQRHYYNGTVSCARAGTIIVTILAGPLNYVGANPKVACHVPRPSK